MYQNVHSNFVHDGPKLVTTQCSPTGERLLDGIKSHMREYHAAVTKNKVLLYTTWMNCTAIMVSTTSHAHGTV